MSTKQVFLALSFVTVLGLAAPRAQAQIVTGGGYVGFGTPGFGGAVSFGTPVAGARRRSTRHTLRGTLSRSLCPAHSTA